MAIAGEAFPIRGLNANRKSTIKKKRLGLGRHSHGNKIGFNVGLIAPSVSL